MTKIANDMKRIVFNNKMIMITLFFLLVVLFMPFYTKYLPNPDTLVYNNGGYYRGIHWELSLGRWGIMFLDTLLGGINSPVLSSMIYFITLTVGTVLVTDIFDIETAQEKLLLGLLLLITPFNGNILTYYYCSYDYGFAFLFMIAALWIYYKNEPKWYINLGCSIGIMLSFSLYQSYAGVGAAMALGIAIYRVLIYKEEILVVIKKTIGFVINAIIGGLAYIMILFVGLKVLNVEMADYKGANNISIGAIVGELGPNFIKAYKEFIGYYFSHDYIGNHFGNCIVSIFIYAVAIVTILFTLKQIKTLFGRILVVFGLLMIPVGANIIDFIVPGSFLSIQAASGNAVCLPVLIALFFGGIKSMRKTKISKFITAVMFILIIGYSWMNVLQIETDALALESANKSGMYAMERVHQTIDEEIKERGELQVAVIGNPEFGNYTLHEDISELASKYALEGILWDYRKNAWYGWSKLLTEEFHATYSFLSPEETVVLSNNAEFKKMGIYPAANSIQVIDNVLVIKVSEMDKFKD